MDGTTKLLFHLFKHTSHNEKSYTHTQTASRSMLILIVAICSAVSTAAAAAAFLSIHRRTIGYFSTIFFAPHQIEKLHIVLNIHILTFPSTLTPILSQCVRFVCIHLTWISLYSIFYSSNGIPLNGFDRFPIECVALPFVNDNTWR